MRLSRQDFRLAIRSFARHPAFAVTAILSLGLAIALNTTMYSVLDAMIRPKLDMRDPDQLYTLTYWGDYGYKVDIPHLNALLRGSMKTYEGVGYQGGSWREVGVEYGKRYDEVAPLIVGADLLRLFGVRPLRGRIFDSTDVNAATQPVMISDRLAATLSPGGDFPIGAMIYVDGVKHPVIGVVSRGSALPSYRRADVLVLPQGPGPFLLNVIRLRPGVRTEDAVKEFEMLSTRLALMAGEDPKYTRIEIVKANKSQFSPQRFHYALIAAVVAVLLVACANLANLQLARGIGRSREMALRAALGASRAAIVAQLLLESALLAAAGLALGLLLTFWGVHALDSRVPPNVAEYVIAPQISWRVFAFAMAATGLCVLLIGLFPAVRVSRVDPAELLKSGAGTGANKKNRQLYGMLVAAEIGLSLALLSGATLVAKTAIGIRSVNPGYDIKPLARAAVYLRAPRDTAINAAAYSNELLARVRSIPDVADAAISDGRSAIGSMITVDERGGTPHEIDAPMFGYDVVTPGYFRTLRLPILKGRDFLDGVATESEAIVDQHTARAVWPGVDPIGLQIKLGAYKSNAPWLRVVGVVAEINDTRQLVMYNRSVMSRRMGNIYVLQTVHDSFTVGTKYATGVGMVVRAKSDPDRLPVTLRRFLPQGGLVMRASTASMEEAMGLLYERLRHDFVASVFMAFAALGIALSALGIYGIVDHTVAERKRELGVRIALGATTRNVLHAVLREGNVVALAGVAIGLYFTKNTAGWLHAFIFEDDEYNAPIFAAVGAVLFVVAVLSALWPALRATRIDPVESLRSE